MGCREDRSHLGVTVWVSNENWDVEQVALLGRISGQRHADFFSQRHHCLRARKAHGAAFWHIPEPRFSLKRPRPQGVERPYRAAKNKVSYCIFSRSVMLIEEGDLPRNIGV